RSDIFPVTLENVKKHPIICDNRRDNVPPKIRQNIIQQSHQHLTVKNINAHRNQIELFVSLDVKFAVELPVEFQGVEHGRLLGLLHKTSDPPLIIDFHNAERLRFGPSNGNGGDGDVRVSFSVLGDDAAKIHPIKLVTAQNNHIFKIVVQEMNQVLAHGIGSALIPGGVR